MQQPFLLKAFHVSWLALLLLTRLAAGQAYFPDQQSSANSWRRLASVPFG